jgi:hypothetical protein
MSVKEEQTKSIRAVSEKELSVKEEGNTSEKPKLIQNDAAELKS